METLPATGSGTGIALASGGKEVVPVSALLWWVRDGCGHVKMSFPITRGEKEAGENEAQLLKTYVVCLDCGKEIPYSWEKMCLVRS